MTVETEVPFDFEFSYTPGERADRDYPGSNPEVIITHVTLFGVTIPLESLSKEVIDQMVDEVLENYVD